jgi:hypothetical protein
MLSVEFCVSGLAACATAELFADALMDVLLCWQGASARALVD